MAALNPLALAALSYAKRGWKVIPLHNLRPFSEIPSCSCHKKTECTTIGKHPFFFKWREIASTDPEMIQMWWRLKPMSNVGVLMGAPSGNLICVDVDGPTGRESLANLEEKYSPLPLTLTQSTGRIDSGQHYFFTVDDIQVDRIRNRARLAPGIDIRANGGLAVFAPSKHSSGQNYSWHDPNAPIATMPDWLYKIAVSVKARKAASSDPSANRPHEEDLPYTLDQRVKLAKKDLKAEGRPAIQGMNGSADCLHAVLLLIRGWCLYEDQAMELLLSEYNPTCIPPWSEVELQHKCHSAENDIQNVPWRYKMSNIGGPIVDAIIAAADRYLDPKREPTEEEREALRKQIWADSNAKPPEGY
jgi:hypothetical protein